AISDDLTYADPETMGVSGPLTMDTAGAEMYATIFSFVASANRPGTLLAGSDDGLVHRSHDDGGSWTNITPPDLPKFSQVTMLAESPHNEGTVYMTVARHKMGDYEPHVFKTTDWGDSWTRITDGIPAGEFCRVIREDPNHAGLLYLGTEIGLHVSFDDGGSWQSLQANLPLSPVYDLLIKDTDLVVATHGRSFWVLDDLTQLHQVAAGLDAGKPALLTPRDTVRTPPDLFADFWGSPGGKSYHVTIGQNATFYLEESETGHKTKRVIDGGTDLERGVRFVYWLPDEVLENGDGDDPVEVTLTISDHDASEIDTFTSTIPEDKKDRAGNVYVTANAGMNTFQWSMRHPSGPKVDGSDFHPPSKGPLCLPGTYQATLSVGGHTSTQSFDLVPDPRVTASAADFRAQFELLSSIQVTYDDLVEAVNRVASLKDRLGDWDGRLADLDHTGAAAVREAIEAVGTRLTAIEDELIQREFTSAGDTLNYREKLIEKLGAVVPVVASADTAPTRQSHQVYEKLAGQITEQLGALDELIDGDLAALNRDLADLGLDIIGT
ncbi:MAG: glycosyl hydrolase, partial [Actinomycetota bacterium]